MRRPPSFLVTQLVVALCSLPAGAAEREPSWLATYDGPGSFASGRGTHLVRDPSGNLYVAGSINWATEFARLVLLKYDRFGDELWRAFYDGPGWHGEEARGLITDSEGNAHVVCTSAGGQTGLDLATLKYSHAGKELWARRYDGGFPWGPEWGAGVAVDSAGNVYVAGYGEHVDEAFENEFDLVTVKYSAEGELQWIRRQDGLQAVGEGSRGRDSPAGIGLDTRENVVVAATCVPSGPALASIVTLLYDPDGDILWATKDLGPSGEAAGVSAMAISAGGDIYLTGSVGAPGEDQAFLTIRKDPSGNVLWKRVFDGDPADEPSPAQRDHPPLRHGERLHEAHHGPGEPGLPGARPLVGGGGRDVADLGLRRELRAGERIPDAVGPDLCPGLPSPCRPPPRVVDRGPSSRRTPALRAGAASRCRPHLRPGSALASAATACRRVPWS